MSDLAPIAVFVYGRLSHTRRTINALKANFLAKSSDLVIYLDAPKSKSDEALVDGVRNYIKSVDGFQSISIIERTYNYGVDASIVDGVTSLCARFGRVVVIEDDIVTSKWFF